MRRHAALFLLFLATRSIAQVGYDRPYFEDIPWHEAQQHQWLMHAGERVASGYDMKYHRIAWTIDPAVRAISGSVDAWFVATTDLTEVVMDMSDTLIVDAVTYHGAPAPYTLTSDDRLTITLPNTLAPGTLDSLHVAYHGVPRQAGFGAFATDEHNGSPVMWTLSEPYGAKEWWPCKEDLNDKIDSIDVFITTDTTYHAAGNGKLVESQVSGSNVTYHWRHRYPIAHYLISTAVADYEVRHDTIHLPGGVNVPMLTYNYQGFGYDAWLSVGDVQQQMTLFTQLFGPYPFANEKYGHAQFGWGGGMEHQTMTSMGGYWYELSAHELAHQWFGDKVTCGSWEDIWLNESFATYVQGLCYDYISPVYWHGWLASKINDAISEPGGSVFCSDTTSVPRIFSGRLSYNKGAMVLHTMRWIIGDSAFYNGARNYLNDPDLAYASARTSDLQAHMESTSGMDLDGFLADWFYGEGYPTYTVVWDQDGGGNVDLTLYQSPSHPSVDFFELPVPIRFKNNDTDSTVVLNNTINGQSFNFHLPFQADSALFDPELWLISAQNIITRVAEAPSLERDLLIVSPNPSTGRIMLRSTSALHGPVEVAITDELGRIWSRTTSSLNDPLSVEELPAGCYMVRVRKGDQDLRARFVKQ